MSLVGTRLPTTLFAVVIVGCAASARAQGDRAGNPESTVVEPASADLPGIWPQGARAAHERNYNTLPSTRTLDHGRLLFAIQLEPATSEEIDAFFPTPPALVVGGFHPLRLELGVGLGGIFDFNLGPVFELPYESEPVTPSGAPRATRTPSDSMRMGIDIGVRALVFTNDTAASPGGVGIMLRARRRARIDGEPLKRLSATVEYSLPPLLRLAFTGEYIREDTEERGLFGLAASVTPLERLEGIAELTLQVRPDYSQAGYRSGVGSGGGSLGVRYLPSDAVAFQVGAALEYIGADLAGPLGSWEWDVWNWSLLLGMTTTGSAVE